MSPNNINTPINNSFVIKKPMNKNKISTQMKVYNKPLLILESDEDIIIRRSNNRKQFKRTMNGTSMFKKKIKNN